MSEHHHGHHHGEHHGHGHHHGEHGHDGAHSAGSDQEEERHHHAHQSGSGSSSGEDHHHHHSGEGHHHHHSGEGHHRRHHRHHHKNGEESDPQHGQDEEARRRLQQGLEDSEGSSMSDLYELYLYGKDRHHTPVEIIWMLIVCGATGAVFGIALEKGRVFEPMAIRDQMTMKRFLMIKMFLSAVSAGIFSFSLMSMLPGLDKKFKQAVYNFSVCLHAKGLLSTVLGSAILGAGMTIAGSCPGMVLAQVGANVPNALYVLGGGLTGALLYGILEPVLVPYTKPEVPIKRPFLFKVWELPYALLAIPFGMAIAGLVYALEKHIPWKSELPRWATYSTGPLLMQECWPPFVAGAVIGCLQIPLVLSVSDTLGSSASYCTIMAQPITLFRLSWLAPYLVKFQYGLMNWWQVIYVGAAIGGAYYSATASHTLGKVPGLPSRDAFIGGVLMVFGSRLAAGCTSGHGLSGMGLLVFLSMIAVPVMFMAGMATAYYI